MQFVARAPMQKGIALGYLVLDCQYPNSSTVNLR